jgi:hypothetical protein
MEGAPGKKADFFQNVSTMLEEYFAISGKL